MLGLALALLCAVARASTGLTELPGIDGDGPVTVFYPSGSEAKPLKRGPFTLTLAWQGAPVRGNGRLVRWRASNGGRSLTQRGS